MRFCSCTPASFLDAISSALCALSPTTNSLISGVSASFFTPAVTGNSTDMGIGVISASGATVIKVRSRRFSPSSFPAMWACTSIPRAPHSKALVDQGRLSAGSVRVISLVSPFAKERFCGKERIDFPSVVPRIQL